MNNNIRVEYKNGKPKLFVLQSTEELRLPSLGFTKEVDAELAIAIAKAMNDRGKVYQRDLANIVKYTFRLLNLNDSEWIE